MSRRAIHATLTAVDAQMQANVGPGLSLPDTPSSELSEVGGPTVAASAASVVVEANSEDPSCEGEGDDPPDGEEGDEVDAYGEEEDDEQDNPEDVPPPPPLPEPWHVRQYV